MLSFLAMLLRASEFGTLVRILDFVVDAPTLSTSRSAHANSPTPSTSLAPISTFSATQRQSNTASSPHGVDFIYKVFSLILSHHQLSHSLRSLTISAPPASFEGQHELVAAIGNLENVQSLHLGPNPARRRGGGDIAEIGLSIGALRALLSSFSHLRRLETTVETWLGDVNQLSDLATAASEQGDEDELSLCRVDHLRLRLDDFRILPHLPLEADSTSIALFLPREPFKSGKEVKRTLALGDEAPSVVAATRAGGGESEWVLLHGQGLSGMVQELEIGEDEWGEVRVQGLGSGSGEGKGEAGAEKMRLEHALQSRCEKVTWHGVRGGG